MEQVKQVGDYTIYKKRSGRYGVRAKDKKWVNGDEKVTILLKEGLITAPKQKAKSEPAEDAAE